MKINQPLREQTDFIGLGIPDELKAIPQWVCWRGVPLPDKHGKLNKIPVSPHDGRNASSTDAATWSDYELACSKAARHGLGVGFVFTKEVGLVGIDLDNCIGEDEWFLDWAYEVIQKFDTYIEYSPSGKGVKVFGKGRKWGQNSKRGDVEMYDSARFFTVTGRGLMDMPPTLEPSQNGINYVYQKYLSTPPKAPRPLTKPLESDNDVITRLERDPKGSKLWAGDRSGYTSKSEADAALVAKLWYYSGDEGQIKRLLLASGLAREKHDREDYLEKTIKLVSHSESIGNRTPLPDVWQRPM